MQITIIIDISGDVDSAKNNRMFDELTKVVGDFAEAHNACAVSMERRDPTAKFLKTGFENYNSEEREFNQATDEYVQTMVECGGWPKQI